MGKVTYLPTQDQEIRAVVTRNGIEKVVIDGKEYEAMSIEEFVDSISDRITPEAEERFVRGLLEIIKEECMGNFRLMKIVKDIFKFR